MEMVVDANVDMGMESNITNVNNSPRVFVSLLFILPSIFDPLRKGSFIIPPESSL